MIFNKHSDLAGKHAILSPSKPYWITYTQDQIRNFIASQYAAVRGTELHDFAANAIKYGIKLRGSTQTLTAYVNDAIGFGMTPEVALKYSDTLFGHADAVTYDHGILRVHDLKTGSGPVHMEQLEIYAALFLAEYERLMGVNPGNTKVVLRIYQNDQIQEYTPDKVRMEEVLAAMKEKEQWATETLREVNQ